MAPTARTLVSAQEIDGQGANAAPVPNNNPYAGILEAVECPYIGTSAGLTNSTNTGWFLMAPPSDFSVLQVVFLNGQQSPMVEQGQFDFNRLGVAWRVVWDWGISTLDHRGGVHLKGAA